MADISQYLENIASAIYGEDVRGSIHDAIDIINKVGIKTLTLGTAVTSSSSSIAGYYQDSVYFNTSTKDVWKCDGTQWVLQGNTKGDKGDTGTAATIAVGTVSSGATASVENSGTSSAAVFDFVLPKGDKGDTGDGLTAESAHSGTNTTVSIKNTTTQAVVDTFTVPDGVPGATGNGIASIAKTATAGLVDTYTITYTDGTSTTFTVTNGADGQGAGDMTKAAYDPTNTVADAGGIPAYVSAHAGTTYTGEKGVVVAGTTIKAALVNDTASSIASETISATADRQYAVNLDSNSKLSVNVPWENTTYQNKTAAQGGTDVSLVTTGDKYNWNNIPNVVANPSASATDTLDKIQIGSTVYDIQGGGTTIVQIPSVSGSSFTYDGTAQGAAITGLDTTHCTVVGGTGTTVTTSGDTTYVKATNAGSYSFSVELNDTSSMVWSDLTTADKSYSFTIAKASQTISASPSTVSLDANTQTASVTVSGASTTLSATSSDTGIATVSGTSSPVTITAVANGSATISIQAQADSNYEASNTVTVPTTVTLNQTVSVTVYSAASDTLSYTDETGAKTVTTDSSGIGSASVTILPSGSSITFTSSVAKNPSDLSQDYSKTVTVTSNTTEIYIMPDANILYWWGYKSNLVNATAANGWGRSGYTFNDATYNTNSVTIIITASTDYEGIASNSVISGTKIHGIGVNTSGNNGCEIRGTTNKGNMGDGSSMTLQASFVWGASMSYQKVEQSFSNVYVYVGNHAYASSNTIYALWYE